MFERDKAELRELGIPLETGRNSHFDSEDGYRITRRDYELPRDRVRRRRGGRRRPRHRGCGARRRSASRARNALIKLRAAGTDVQDARHARRRPQPRHQRPEPAGAARSGAHGPSGALRLRQGRRATRRSRARSSRGACCRGAAGGTSPASTATATSRAASGSRASPGAVEFLGPPGAFERPDKVDLLEMVAGRRLGGRPGRARAGRPAARRRRCAASPMSDDGRRARDHLLRHPLAGAPGRAARVGRAGARPARTRRRGRRPAARRGRGGAATDGGDEQRAAAAAAAGARAVPAGASRASRSPRPPPTSGVTEDAAAPRPAAAVDVRAARPRPGRPDRPVLRGRDGVGDLRRRHVAAAAADRPRRRWRSSSRCARWPRRRASPTSTPCSARWPRSRRPPAARSTARPSRSRSTRTAELLPVAAPRGGREPRAAAALLDRDPRRDDRAHRRPAAGVRRSTGTPTSRRGAAAPRACGCSGSTGSRTSRCSTSRPARRKACSCATSPKACTSRRPSTCSPCCGCRRPTRGSPTTTRPRTSPNSTPTGCRSACGSSEPAWVRSLVLGSGGQVEVLSPGWLAESIRADAARALAAYAAK